jgi:hypothetical protein
MPFNEHKKLLYDFVLLEATYDVLFERSYMYIYFNTLLENKDTSKRQGVCIMCTVLWLANKGYLQGKFPYIFIHERIFVCCSKRVYGHVYDIYNKANVSQTLSQHSNA